jgi:beta-glucanase (GH16 family)
MVNIKERFTRGYFEARCICSKVIPPSSFWSAFWIQARNPYNAEISKGGIGGAEIDIFEGVCKDGADGIEQNIHCKGVKGSTSKPGQTDHLGVGRFFPPNLCSDYNVFGLEWTDKEYIFYINGEEVSRTSYGDGVSQVDEEVIVSLELPDRINFDKTYHTEFITDYVRVYQKD